MVSVTRNQALLQDTEDWINIAVNLMVLVFSYIY